MEIDKKNLDKITEELCGKYDALYPGVNLVSSELGDYILSVKTRLFKGDNICLINLAANDEEVIDRVSNKIEDLLIENRIQGRRIQVNR